MSSVIRVRERTYQSSVAFGNVQTYLDGGARELRFGVTAFVVLEWLRRGGLERRRSLLFEPLLFTDGWRLLLLLLLP